MAHFSGLGVPGENFNSTNNSTDLLRLLDSDFVTANSANWTNDSQTTAEPIEYVDPVFYSLSYRIIGTIFQGIVLVVGVLGNVMVVIVVLRTRSMHTPTNCYLVSLSCADLVVLLFSVPNEIFAYYLLGDEWIWGWIGCVFFIYFQYMGINASALSITAFTIERYIAICHPMRAQTICTVSRAKKIIISVWLFAIIYCSPWLFLTKTQTLHYRGYEDQYLETCTFKVSRQYYLGLFFADLVLFYVLPLILSVILYILIAVILFTNDIPKTPGKKNGAVCSSDSKKTSSTNNARVQVVKMLVVVVAVFAIFWLPYRLLVVYNSLAKERYMELWYLMFCKTMVFMNSAINPILYNAMSIKFRRAFKRMLSCNPHRPGQRSSRNRTQTFYTSVALPAAGSSSLTPNQLVNNGHDRSCRAVRSQQFSEDSCSSPIHNTQLIELTSCDMKSSSNLEV